MRKTDRSLRTRRTTQARPFLETLEDRTLLSTAFAPDALNRNLTAGFAGNNAETSIVVTPDYPNQIFAASNPPATPPGGFIWRFSRDGGQTWANSNTGGLPIPGSHVHAAATVSTLYVVYLDVPATAVVVARSYDGGRTFPEFWSFAGTGLDQPSIVTARPSGVNAHAVMCISYRDTGAPDPIVARCLSRGPNGWSAPQRVPGSGGGNFSDIAIDANFGVVVSYQTPSTTAGPSTIRVHRDPDGLFLAGGFDAGQSWSTNVGGLAPITPQPARTVHAEANLACHWTGPSCYIAYVDRPAVASNDTNIFFRRSQSGGPWSTPQRVNDDVGTNSQFNPAIDVDQATGDVGITWLDARNAGPANNTVQVWGTVLYHGNTWFWPNHPISNGTSSCITAGAFNCGDQDTGSFHNGVLYRSWADNSNPSRLTPANATPPSQDLAMGRVLVDTLDVGGTLATAHNLNVGPAPCDFAQVIEPIGNDNHADGGGRGRRDVDMYRLDANAGTTVTIRTHHPAGGWGLFSTFIRLFNAAGAQLASNDNDEPATDHYSRLTFTFTAAGVYYIGISDATNSAYNPTVYGSGVDGAIGDYGLDVTLADRPDVGDTAAAALVTPLGPGLGSYHRPCEVVGNGAQNRRDVDLYRVQATAGQVLTAVTVLPPGGDSGDTLLRIFNAGLVQVAIDDDGGDGAYSVVAYAVPATGIYYVGVSAYPNSAYNPAVAGSGATTNERLQLGDYGLYIGNGAPAADVGDTLATALNTGMGPGISNYQRNWEVVGNGGFGTRDVDLYRFTANVGMRFTAATSLPPGANVSMGTVISVWHSTGSRLQTSGYPGSYYASINSFRIPATGTYYLGVSGAPRWDYNPTVAGSGPSEGEIGDYRLSMSMVPGPVSRFWVDQSVYTTTAGTPYSVTVSARDDGNNIVTNYTGTVTFSTNEPSGGTLPANYTFVPADNGVHTFVNGVTLYVAGTWVVSAAQVGSPGINGSVLNHTVTPGPVWYYYVYEGDTSAPPPSVTRGVPFPIYILPFDMYFNWITNYAGTISFWTPDPLGVVPANYTFTGTEGGIGSPGTVTFGTLSFQEMYVWNTGIFSAFGSALYRVLPPLGPTPGGEDPGSGDVADLLANAARPADAAPAAPLDRSAAPALDAGSVELLFARPTLVAPQEAVGQLVAEQRPAPVVEQWSTLIMDEMFLAV